MGDSVGSIGGGGGDGICTAGGSLVVFTVALFSVVLVVGLFASCMVPCVYFVLLQCFLL